MTPVTKEPATVSRPVAGRTQGPSVDLAAGDTTCWVLCLAERNRYDFGLTDGRRGCDESLAVQTSQFDDRHIAWQMVDANGAQVFVLATNEVLGIADLLIKFQASRWKSCTGAYATSARSLLQGDVGISSP
jgi:hypothetical protein